MSISRRAFLTTGGLAAVALAIGGAGYRYRYRYRDGRAAPAAAFVLNGDAGVILDAIIAAMLAGAMPAGAATGSTVAAVLKAIGGLPLSAQQEIQGLFSLLALAPVRRLLAGVTVDWAEATPAQVSAFLQRWRLHFLSDLRVAYAALHDMILGAWYAEPAHWAALDYPGPMAALSI
ncbi:twin-arginine translocation signal domain-containing protein [Massilia sp. PWRC2]|uniref:twin-arginine translocation signal domain-containing protein n=1 Tax=Massilia sp. PWRC2 TaxID=2804626 RepID=UPI003CF2E663